MPKAHRLADKLEREMARIDARRDRACAEAEGCALLAVILTFAAVAVALLVNASL